MDKQRILETERVFLLENDFHAMKVCLDVLLSEIAVQGTENRWIGGGYLNITFRARKKDRVIRLPLGNWKSSPSYHTEKTIVHDREEDKRIAKLWYQEYMKLRKEFIGE